MIEIVGCFTLLLLRAVHIHASESTPRTDCPEYVEENAVLSCSCLAPYNFQGRATYSWPDHSDTAVLTVTSVNRKHFGTRYTCHMVTDKYQASTYYTLKVVYGPDEGRIKISPLEFVTNWTQTFRVICTASDVYPGASFRWTGIKCYTGDEGSTCTFTPRSETKTIAATCHVTRDAVNSIPARTVSKTAHLVMKYAPTEWPKVSAQAADQSLLRTGDKLTCTVTGGNPPVNEVNFYCSRPPQKGRPGVASATSTSSTITLDFADSTEDQMMCYCSAVWKPEPSFYPKRVEMSYTVEVKASVTNLTVGGVSNTKTATGRSGETVPLVCQTFGRPRPTDVKLTKVDNDNLADAHKAQVSNTGRWRSESTVTLSDVQCSDMGTYVCTASNGVGPADSRSVVLNVRCPPRKYFRKVLQMIDDILAFSLAAYPSPDRFRFFHLGNRMSGSGSEVLSGRFSSMCLQNAVGIFMVKCTIAPVNVPKSLLGYYRLTVINDLGSVNVTFCMNREAVPENQGGNGQVNQNATRWKTTIAIVASVAALVVVLVVLAAVGYYRSSSHGPRRDRRRRSVGVPSISAIRSSTAVPSTSRDVAFVSPYSSGGSRGWSYSEPSFSSQYSSQYS